MTDAQTQKLVELTLTNTKRLNQLTDSYRVLVELVLSMLPDQKCSLAVLSCLEQLGARCANSQLEEAALRKDFGLDA